MHQIRYEKNQSNKQTFYSYKINFEYNKFQRIFFDKDLKHILEYIQDYQQYKHSFLLDEKYFSFFRYDFFDTFDENININQLNHIIREQCNIYAKKHNIKDTLLTSYIDSIFINWEEKKFIIWHKGKVFFRIYWIFLKKDVLNTFNAIYGNILNKKNITIIPKSFHTSLFIRNVLKKDNFLLFYIWNTNSKVIKIQNWFYNTVKTINLWVDSLKKMYKDNNILEYFDQKYEFIEKNKLAKDLILQTLHFFVDLLTRRMYEENLIWSDIFLISSIIQNTHFVEIFDETYKKYTNNYTIPFHKSQKLKDFPYKDNINSRIYFNYLSS